MAARPWSQTLPGESGLRWKSSIFVQMSAGSRSATLDVQPRVARLRVLVIRTNSRTSLTPSHGFWTLLRHSRWLACSLTSFLRIFD